MASIRPSIKVFLSEKDHIFSQKNQPQFIGILLDESEYPNKMSVSHYGGDMVNFKDQPFVVAGRDTLIAETLVTLADGDPGWRATEKIPGLKQRYFYKLRLVNHKISIRAFLSAVTFQNQVWAFGGRDSRVDMADVYVYNGKTYSDTSK